MKKIFILTTFVFVFQFCLSSETTKILAGINNDYYCIYPLKDSSIIFVHQNEIPFYSTIGYAYQNKDTLCFEEKYCYNAIKGNFSILPNSDITSHKRFIYCRDSLIELDKTNVDVYDGEERLLWDLTFKPLVYTECNMQDFKVDYNNLVKTLCFFHSVEVSNEDSNLYLFMNFIKRKAYEYPNKLRKKEMHYFHLVDRTGITFGYWKMKNKEIILEKKLILNKNGIKDINKKTRYKLRGEYLINNKNFKIKFSTVIR